MWLEEEQRFKVLNSGSFVLLLSAADTHQSETERDGLPTLILLLERHRSWKVSTRKRKRNKGLLAQVTPRSGTHDLKKPKSFGCSSPQKRELSVITRFPLWGDGTAGNGIKEGEVSTNEALAAA